MSQAIKKEITIEQARQRTAAHKQEFATLKKGWHHLGKEVARSVDLQVPSKLGMTMRAWLDQTFEQSASHVFRQLANVRALKGISQSTLEAIPEASAHELTRLKEKDRKDPKIVQAALEQSPKEFKQTVAKVREEKYGIKTEQWDTLAVRLPRSVYSQAMDAQSKVAEVLDLDIVDDAVRARNLITIWEAIFALVNMTPIERLTAEIEGDEIRASEQRPNEASPIS